MTKNQNMAGLTSAEAKRRQEQYGKNELTSQKKENFFKKIIHIICEPMFLLLIIAAVIYFLLGEPKDGLIMLIFVTGIISIDVIQEWKTDKTLNALKNLSSPQVTVIRDGDEQLISAVNIVPGDLIMVYEGVKIPADGSIVKCSDLCVDESMLTGESDGVWKNACDTKEKDGEYWRKDYCYAGTSVLQGTAIIQVNKIGMKTEYGKIGGHITSISECQTPLQKQTGKLVKLCAGIAAVFFALVCIFTFISIPNFVIGSRIIKSILSGVTLAMAMIPEEFPVILTVFLSMGAWRLAKKNSIVRKLPSVETLGAISVLCVDKTGTVTLNKMTVQNIWAKNGDINKLCEAMALGCETDAYDPMEKAMLSHCDSIGITDKALSNIDFFTEYPFTNELKMMGHVWKRNDDYIVAAKGSPESILTICNLNNDERQAIKDNLLNMSNEGLRVIAVATQIFNNQNDIPKKITDCKLTFLGLVGLSDPPRDDINKDIALCRKAGIKVVMITGDNGITAASIAKKIGIDNYNKIITGDMLDNMTDEELMEKVENVGVFSRVIPEHKMRIVKAFKDSGEVVAMTGDGVNDAPALKYADIGIAMGKRGSEVSKEAADLILLDDNFTTIVETVKDGRRIYDNIRKAVGYVLVIHIPIALSALLAPMLGITPEAFLLLPLHIMLLEIIIDPTCSVIFERQPAEIDIMERKPRNSKENILNKETLVKSILQGMVIFIASFGTYLFALADNPDNAPLARTMGLAVIVLSNLLLVQVNSSDHNFALTSIMRLARDKIMWITNIVTVLGLILIIYTPISSFLKLTSLTLPQLISTIVTAVLAVIWYEAVKLLKRFMKNKNK